MSFIIIRNIRLIIYWKPFFLFVHGNLDLDFGLQSRNSDSEIYFFKKVKLVQFQLTVEGQIQCQRDTVSHVI